MTQQIRKFCFLTIIMTAVAMTAKAGNYTYTPKAIVFGWNGTESSSIYDKDGNAFSRLVVNDGGITENNHKATWVSSKNEKVVYYNDFYMYYPYDEDYASESNYKALPIYYDYQKQTDNKTTAHLAAFDYMTSTTRATPGTFAFELNHLGAMLRIVCHNMPASTVTGVSLSSDQDIFTTEATMNVTNNTVASTKKAKQLDLTIDNASIAAGDSLVAYMMVCPDGLSSKTISVSVQTSTNTYEMKFDLPEISAGTCYQLNGEILAAPTAANSSASKAKAKSITAAAPTMPTTMSELKPSSTASDFAITTVPMVVLKGDVNNDGKVDVVDVADLVEDIKTGAKISKNVCDLNNDNVIDVDDVKALASKIISNK